VVSRSKTGSSRECETLNLIVSNKFTDSFKTVYINYMDEYKLRYSQFGSLIPRHNYMNASILPLSEERMLILS